jgi:hypothetical protein
MTNTISIILYMIFYLFVHRTGIVLVFLVFFFLDWHRVFKAFASTNPGDA